MISLWKFIYSPWLLRQMNLIQLIQYMYVEFCLRSIFLKNLVLHVDFMLFYICNSSALWHLWLFQIFLINRGWLDLCTCYYKYYRYIFSAKVVPILPMAGSTVWHPGCKNTARTEERYRERVGIDTLSPFSSCCARFCTIPVPITEQLKE